MQCVVLVQYLSVRYMYIYSYALLTLRFCYCKFKEEASNSTWYIDTDTGEQIAKIQPLVTDTLSKRFYLSDKAARRDSQGQNNVNNLSKESELITQLPARITSVACDQNGRLMAAVGHDSCNITAKNVMLQVFKRHDNHCWTHLSVTLGLDEAPFKV